MKTVKNPRQVALVAALGLCAGVSGCSWVSAILAETPTLPPVEAAPRASAMVRTADGIRFVGATQATPAAVALPPQLAQPSRFIAETTTVAAPPPKAEAAPVALVARVDSPTPKVAAAPQPPHEGTPESDLLRRLESWRQSWESGRFESYQRFYDGAFRGASSSRAAWESGRKDKLGAANISVKLSDVRTTAVGPDEVRVDFVQQYASARHRDTGHKTMTLRRDPQRGWVIVEESWRSKA
jgi:hypothetical protein